MSTDVSVDGTADEPVLYIERRYPHRAEHVWSALTEPDQLSKWFPCRIEVDLRVDGVITFLFPGEEPDTGIVTELDPPRTFGFTWAGEHLRWTVEPAGEGCILRLRNTIVDPDWTANTAAGWDVCWQALAQHLHGQLPVSHPGPDEALIAHYRSVLTRAAGRR